MTSFTLYSMSIVENCRSAWIFAALCVGLTCPAVQAADWRPLVSDNLLQRWHQIGGDDHRSSVSFPTLSASYQFPDCVQIPEVNLIRTLQPGRNGVELRCHQPFWTQTLAVDLEVYQDVVVLTEDAVRDQPVSAAQVTLVEMNTADLSQGYLTSPEEIDGMMLKRSLRAGTPLNPDMLEPADIVERGQPVTIRLNRPGIRIEMKGSALSAGHLGERIRVRNEQTDKTLYAEVVADGLVQVR